MEISSATAPCRCAKCMRTSNTVCPKLPWRLAAENPEELVRLDSAVERLLAGPHGSFILRSGSDTSPGALQQGCSHCGLVLGPELAHSLVAFSRWRWIIVNLGCARHGWRWQLSG